MEIPIKMDDLGYHHFRKHPYMEHLLCISVDRLDFILSLPHAGIGMIHSGVIMYMLIYMHYEYAYILI